MISFTGAVEKKYLPSEVSLLPVSERVASIAFTHQRSLSCRFQSEWPRSPSRTSHRARSARRGSQYESRLPFHGCGARLLPTFARGRTWGTETARSLTSQYLSAGCRDYWAASPSAKRGGGSTRWTGP